MKSQKILVGIAVALMALSVRVSAATVKVLADTSSLVTLEVSTDYAMGDSDSTADAREFALQEAKRKAAGYAGTIVESKLVVSGNAILSDQVRTMSAAFLKTDIQSERLKLVKGRPVYEVNSRVVVDKTLLVAKANQLKDDQALRTYIDLLEEQNNQLQQRLSGLNIALQNTTSGADVTKKLLTTRREVMEQLQATSDSVQRGFTNPSLLDLALLYEKREALASAHLYALLHDIVEVGMIYGSSEPIFKKTDVDSYEVTLKIDWHIPRFNELCNFLKKNLDSCSLKASISEKNGDDKFSYGEAYRRVLMQNVPVMRVTVGSREVSYVVAEKGMFSNHWMLSESGTVTVKLVIPISELKRSSDFKVAVTKMRI